MTQSIGVVPEITGLQKDVVQKLKTAYRKGDQVFISSLKTFLLMSTETKKKVFGTYDPNTGIETSKIFLKLDFREWSLDRTIQVLQLPKYLKFGSIIELLKKSADRIEEGLDHVEAELVKLKVKDLGFSKGASYGTILKKAREVGLNHCRVKVAPVVCAQYFFMFSLSHFTYVAIEPILHDSRSRILEVMYKDGQGCIADFECNMRTVFKAEDEFLFEKAEYIK